MKALPDIKGLLILPRLRIQNANAISSPMTHGFPSITAFLGLMWALERKLGERHALMLDAVGVICHQFEEQVTTEGYPRAFRLTRNPVDRDGSTAAIVEEGRIHLDITLVFGVSGPVLNASDDEKRAAAEAVADAVAESRIAGGSVITSGLPAWKLKAELEALGDSYDGRAKTLRRLRRRWLPGFALVCRDDLLQSRLDEMRAANPDASALDAWLHSSRLNWCAVQSAQADGGTSVEWKFDERKGWIVPIPVGYGALTDVYPAGSVTHARDPRTPLRFVESLYSLGEWVSPHRITDINALLWYGDAEEASGLYRARNAYSNFAATIQN